MSLEKIVSTVKVQAGWLANANFFLDELGVMDFTMQKLRLKNFY